MRLYEINIFTFLSIFSMEKMSGKWLILVATIWIQAFTGTNFNFSAYSTELKSISGFSQMQLIFLSMASDMGKAFGWCAGICLLYFPLPVVLFMSAFMGLFGYGLQWLVIQKFISLPYFAVFLLCLLAGCSICWFNTVCIVLCIQNFPLNIPIALALCISYNSVSAALYNLIGSSIESDIGTLYLLLNAIIPLITSIFSTVLITWKGVGHDLPSDANHHDYLIFLYLALLAVFTGIYLLIVNMLSFNSSIACALLGGAIVLLLLPLIVPKMIHYYIETSCLNSPSKALDYILVNTDEPEVQKPVKGTIMPLSIEIITKGKSSSPKKSSKNKVGLEGQCMVMEEENSVKTVLKRLDFWLYYIAYFCGGTVGLVYSNNLGQVSQSLGYHSDISSLVSLYSACSFFGRLVSAAPEFLNMKSFFPRTGLFAISLAPISFSFFVLVLSGSKIALLVATALIGLSSGYIFSASVSITAELFGPKSAGVNHNILITNISLGSFIYGGLASMNYEANIERSNKDSLLEESLVCIGRKCYGRTFVWAGWISLVGLASSYLLFSRTKAMYNRLERNRTRG